MEAILKQSSEAPIKQTLQKSKRRHSQKVDGKSRTIRSYGGFTDEKHGVKLG